MWSTSKDEHCHVGGVQFVLWRVPQLLFLTLYWFKVDVGELVLPFWPFFPFEFAMATLPSSSLSPRRAAARRGPVPNLGAPGSCRRSSDGGLFDYPAAADVSTCLCPAAAQLDTAGQPNLTVSDSMASTAAAHQMRGARTQGSTSDAECHNTDHAARQLHI